MTSLAAQYVSDGAVGFFKYNDAVGSTTVADTIGNSNGTLSGSFTLGQGGIAGGAGDTGLLTASGQCAVPDVAAQRVVDTFTIEVWIKRSTLGTLQGIIGGNASGTPALRFQTDNTVQFFKQSVQNICSSTVAVTDTSRFHQIAVTKTGATTHLYIDGADVTGTVTNSVMGTTSGHGWQILWDAVSSFIGSGATYAYAGLFPTALSAAQIGVHYTEGTTGTAPTNTAVPVISGTTKVGSVITSTAGSWTDVYGSGVSAYQWQRDSGAGYRNVSSGTQPTYLTKRGDESCSFKCAVTFTNSGGSATATSTPLGPYTLPSYGGLAAGIAA